MNIRPNSTPKSWGWGVVEQLNESRSSEFYFGQSPLGISLDLTNMIATCLLWKIKEIFIFLAICLFNSGQSTLLSDQIHLIHLIHIIALTHI